MAITIERQGNRYIARFPFSHATKDIVKAAGFRFDGASKLWWTTDPEKAARVAQPGIAAELTARAAEIREQLTAAIASSAATDAAIDVPAPDGLAYLPYQRAGIAYAMSRAATLIGDEMGLGKTIEAIGVINADPAIKSVLVICPASLKLNWRNELSRWLTRPLSIGICNGVFPATEVVIINFDILGKQRAAIDARQWDLLIVDEAHFLKNPKAQRTQAVYGKWDRDESKRITPISARRRLFMTGTPIVNRPIELWPLIQNIRPEGLPRSWRDYAIRYCNGHQSRFGWDVSGASNLPELQQKLRSSIMVRRLKKDVLTELPPKRRQIIVLPAEGEAIAAVKAESAGYAAIEARLESARVVVELAKAGDDKAAYELAVAELRDLTNAAFTQISQLRHDTAVAKVPQVIEHLTEALDSDEKVVLMAHHHDVVDAIAEAFPGAAIITGEVAVNKRQAEVERFQNDPACRLFIGSIQAAGLGITLTAAAHVIFAELDWTPGNMTQAEDRCHRIGQRDNVLVQHLVLDGSLDARMAHTLVAKQEVIDRALDRETELPAAPVFADTPATANASVSMIAAEAATIAPAARAAILVGLQMLAGVCDGARNLDNAGFNRIDTAIGKSLAMCDRLSPKQAALGARLVRKYRRQLPEALLAEALNERTAS
jgi:SWI/SNF-related matrix-associated actin-dependent regulator 1 of chromatin subfamily A